MNTEEVMAKILEEILVEGDFYRKHCHRCMYWHAKKGCSLDWYGCYHVQEELENRIEKAQKKAPKMTGRPVCCGCSFRKQPSNCRLLCTRRILIQQGICFPDERQPENSPAEVIAVGTV